MGKKVMILSASAGSGHIRAAAAIEEACRNDPRISEILNVDTLTFTNGAFQRIYSKGYLEAVKAAPELWAWAFEKTDKPWKNMNAISWMHRVNSQPLVKKIRQFEPDICICTHGMPAEIISRQILQNKIQTNLGIVVTDYYVHAMWYTDLFTRYFVPKEESKAHMSALGIPSDRILVSGIPVMHAFSAPAKLPELRAKHGIKEDLPLVLLSAGTFGVMSAADIVKILEEIKTQCQIVVVCGKNEKLRKSLQTHLEAQNGSMHNSYTIVGYTDAMHDYLKMADLFIGKPGGLATSECMVCGVPMVIWDPIPGQEVYNTYHVLEHGAGVMPNNALTIGFKVDEILSNPDKRQHMSEAAHALSFPDAAKTVVDAMLANEFDAPVKAFRKRNGRSR
jgi:processive 1,2-diacylglycerol beta-glucosyltransferase